MLFARRVNRREGRLRSTGRRMSHSMLYFLIVFAYIEKTSAQCPFLSLLDKDSVELGLQPNEEGDWANNILLSQMHRKPAWQSQVQGARELRRYDHYKSGSAYEYHNSRNRPPSYSKLGDVWLCLACALGWTVWLVSATRSQNPLETASVFESQDSKTVHGNVLQVTLGEDADGTGIPIYHTLVDYVVESQEADEEPLQVRKCFSTTKLLEEGFANVEVLVLVEDPTTSILMDDFLQTQTDRVKQQMEPPSLLWSIGVYTIAATLIATSLVGGLHAFIKLHPEQVLAGKISLGVGTVLLYPTAVVLYHFIAFMNRWSSPLSERPGVIIHGARDYWKRKCGATLNPLEIMGTFDDAGEGTNSPRRGSTVTGSKVAGRRNLSKNQQLQSQKATNWPDGLELPEMTKNTEGGQANQNIPLSPRYPNAGCSFGNFNVNVPAPRKHAMPTNLQEGATTRTESEDSENLEKGYDLDTISVSSMSSATGNQSHDLSTHDHTSTVASNNASSAVQSSVFSGAFAALPFPTFMGGGETSKAKHIYEPPFILQESYPANKESSSSITTKQSTPMAPGNNCDELHSSGGNGVGLSTSSSNISHRQYGTPTPLGASIAEAPEEDSSKGVASGNSQ